MAHEIVVLVTAASQEEASQIAGRLVEEKLAACANIIPGVRSIFSWRGEICDESEVLLIIKTTRKNLCYLVEMVEEIHSYEVPEIIALPIVGGSEDYLSWLNEEASRE